MAQMQWCATLACVGCSWAEWQSMLYLCPPIFSIASTLVACLRQKPPGTSNLDSSALAKPSEENAAVGNSAPQTSESGGWRFIQPSLLAKLLFHMLQDTKRNKNEIIHMQLQWVKYPIFTVA